MLTDLKKEDRIRLLRKILYGLHRHWHTKCKEVLNRFGLETSFADPCLHYSGQGEDALLSTLMIYSLSHVTVQIVNVLKIYLKHTFWTY